MKSFLESAEQLYNFPIHISPNHPRITSTEQFALMLDYCNIDSSMTAMMLNEGVYFLLLMAAINEEL